MKNKLIVAAALYLLNFHFTADAQPVVTTQAATGVTATNATLNGTVNPNGASTTTYFQYGLTTNYGNIGTATVLPAGNAALAVPGFVVNSLRGAAGPGLASTAAGIRAWTCIASSTDGLKLAAVATYGDTIYTSTNAGTSWMTSSAPYVNWQSIASSADGVRLAAGIDGGGIYTSTNSGLTWTPSSATNASWDSIASSFDGTRLAAAASGDGIYTSTNGGLTWTQSSARNDNWAGIASSADGGRLAAVGYYGIIYTSTNGGLTWAVSNDRITQWEGIASSADGTRLVAGASFDLGVYLSTDSGASWTRSSGFIGYGSCHAIASSADGMRLAGVSRQGSVFTSTDGGLTWNVLHSPGRTLVTVAMSADGTRLAVPYSPGLIYTSAGVASSLLPGTLYHYQLVGINVAGTTRGADLTFTTLSGAPTVTTLAASSVTRTNARLNGVVNTGGLSTTAYFQYGLTTNYGSFSATNTLAATNTTLSVSNLIASLAPITTYHFRLVGSNSAGTNLGVDLTFTTDPLLPTVTTLAASSVTASNSVLRGTVNPNSAATSAYFQYGLTTNYGSFSATNALAATNTTLSVSNLISLAPGTTYHFRLVGINSAGATLGGNLTFTTGPLAPTAITLTASGATVTNATLNGTVNPNGAATTAYFQYGLTTNYGSFSTTNSLVATNATLAVAKLIGGLTPGTAYHFRLVANNSIGSAFGGDQTIGIPYTFGGADPGQGLDLQGAFVYAVNLGSNGAPGLIGEANFTADNVSGVTITTPGGTLNTINNWTSPNFGATTNGLRLAQAMSSIRWTGSPGTFTVNLDGLQVGGTYKLQLLFIEANSSTDRAFDVSVNGTPIVPNFRLLDYGPVVTPIVIPYLFTAASTSALIELGGGTVGTDHNPIMSAFTLETLAPITTTLAASSVTATNARLNGTVNPNGAATTAYFQYGLTTNYGSFTATNSLAATNTTLSVSNLISGLTLGTTYHFRLVALNSAGSSLGGNLTLTTVSSPTVTTLAASSVTATNASLNGSVNPGNGATTAYFQYGLTTNYGSFSTTNSLAATNSTMSVSNLIGGLTPGTTYHFRLVGGNSVGTTLGTNLTFTTSPLAPTASTLAASSVTATNASLNGSVNPSGIPTTAYFQYGLTTNYGSFTATNNLAATNTTLSVSNLISGLTPGTTYHFRIVGNNVGGTVPGADLTFTTATIAPAVTTLAASSLTATNANLNGSVNPGNGATIAYFQYGLTTNYGSFSATNNLAATNATLSISNLIGGLTLGTTYHFRLVGINSAGTTVGNDLTLTTLGPPTVTTLAATAVGSTNATLNGTANPNGAATTAYFQYGLTTNYGNLGTFTGLPATNIAQTVPGLVVNSVITGGAGINWTLASAPSAEWYSIASSSAGIWQVAVVSGGGIYTSTNIGVTWTQSSAPTADWRAVASSADGVRLAAVVIGGGIHTSTNRGVTWTQSAAPNAAWVSITSSSDGTRLAAVVSGGGIYTSTNGGVSWTPSGAPAAGWSSIASSSDGTRLAATVNGGGNIYTSTDGGATWTPSSAPNASWVKIASSSDGTRLAAVVIGERIYTSTNSGVTWTPTSAPSQLWTSIASSDDGLRLAAGINGGRIYSSTNGGVTWTQSDAPNASWFAMACSGDGTRLTAGGVGGGRIYTSVGAKSSLAPNTTYHYQLVGFNSQGTGLGNDLTFTTVGLPTVTTVAASSVTATNATLNGTVNPGNGATTAYFQYGLTTGYGSFSATNSLVATNTTLAVSNLISGLTPGTTYHFRLVALNSAGSSLGGDLLFTTALFQPVPFSLNGSIQSSGGAFQLSFTNLSGLGFTVVSATNLGLALSNWTVLGVPVEAPPGQYQFTDLQATNNPIQFYRVRSP